MTGLFSALDASKSIKALSSIMALGTFFNDLKKGTASGTPAQKATFWGDLVRLPGAAADVVKFGIDRAVSSTNAWPQSPEPSCHRAALQALQQL